MVLMTEGSVLGYPEIQRGFVPAMVMAVLRRLVGERAAFDLVATGRLVQGAEAVRLGLASRVLVEEAFEQEAAQILAQLAGAPPSAMHLTKQLLYELDGLSMGDGIALGARINALARTTPEFREAIQRFLARPG
jgi:methylglutaconyl-CoA hydratase